MSRTCPPADQLAGLTDLPETDPRRAHLRDCPRCRAVLASYRVFMDEAAAAATPGRERAEARLEAAIAAESGSEIAADPPGRARPSARESRSWRRSARLALGFAAVLLAVVALRSTLIPPDEGAPRLRGPDLIPGAAAWQLDPPALQADGSVVLSWAAPAAGREHRVEIYDAGLATVASFGPVSGSELVLPASRLRELAPAAGPFRWRVVAFRDGDPIDRSPMAILELPLPEL